MAAHGGRAIATIGSPGKAAMLQERLGLPAQRILVSSSVYDISISVYDISISVYDITIVVSF